jgi:hypothetical protein
MRGIPPMTTPCGGPPLHVLRQLDAGELSQDQSVRVNRHVESCGPCRAVLREFTADRDAVRTVLPFPALESRLALARAPRRWPWRRLGFALLLPAAGVAAFLLVPKPPVELDGDKPGVHRKGADSTTAPTLDFFVQTSEGARLVAVNEQVKPGDSIRFRYTSLDKPFVLIVGVDADGHVFPYLTDGDRSARASSVPLALAPNSVQLDSLPMPRATQKSVLVRKASR